MVFKTDLKLADWVIKIEDYYTKIKGKWTPMDVEWAIDGLTKDLFIVQARPETIHSQKNNNIITEYRIADAGREDKIVVKGIAVGDKIGSGVVNILVRNYQSWMYFILAAWQLKVDFYNITLINLHYKYLAIDLFLFFTIAAFKVSCS